MSFGKPDSREKKANQEQKEPEIAENNAVESANDNAQSKNGAFDMMDYVAESRESASTGRRKKLEANTFNDEALLEEEGYTKSDNSKDFFEPEYEEEEEEGEDVEISEEWLDIFAWAGVELTDEMMPRMLQYLHAENDPTRFKLEPSRRDKLKIAWLAFLRRVLPNWSDQQGLIAVIIMLYIENIVVGVWKLFMRIMSGTFTMPDIWPFNRFNRTKIQEFTAAEEDDFEYEPPRTENEPMVYPENGQPDIVTEVVEVAKEDAAKMSKSAEGLEKKNKKSTVEKTSEIIIAPEPHDLGEGKVQDAIDQIPYTKERGSPRKNWEKPHPETGKIYKVAKGNFRTQKTLQKWLWAEGFYSNRANKRGRKKLTNN